MNPFVSTNRTLTAISVNVINMRSLSTTVAGATYKKITRLLDMKSEVNIIIDSRTSLNGVNNLFNSQSLKWHLSHFKHKGSYTPAKGIVMIYDRTRVQVDDLNVIQDRQRLSFRLFFLIKLNIFLVADINERLSFPMFRENWSMSCIATLPSKFC